MSKRNNEKTSRAVFPIAMMTDNRPVLVVGGGKIATRKVGLLLDAQAHVTVVAPEVTRSLEELIDAGRIRHEAREFAEADLVGQGMVFAATDDRSVNRTVLQAARAKGVLCSSVDGNWPEGDFVTPAILRRDNLMIAISTGGHSCRRSRMVKDSLDRHIDSVNSADLLVIGTSHNYLSVNQREPYQLVGKRLARVGRMLMGVWGLHEFMLLNTCNRVELLAVARPGADVEELLKDTMDLDRVRSDQCYVKRGVEAFEHMVLTTAGLLSQTPGEYHIVSQVKEALAWATEAGWASGLMQEWMSHVLHVSKDIRNVTSELLRGFEIEDLCLEYIDAECNDLSKQRVLVLGAGTVAEGTVRRLVERD